MDVLTAREIEENRRLIVECILRLDKIMSAVGIEKSKRKIEAKE